MEQPLTDQHFVQQLECSFHSNTQISGSCNPIKPRGFFRFFVFQVSHSTGHPLPFNHVEGGSNDQRCPCRAETHIRLKPRRSNPTAECCKRENSAGCECIGATTRGNGQPAAAVCSVRLAPRSTKSFPTVTKQNGLANQLPAKSGRMICINIRLWKLLAGTAPSIT